MKQSKKTTKKLGARAKTLFERAEKAVESGSKVVDGLKTLDHLFAHGLKLVPNNDPIIDSLQRENHAMRTALCALLVAAGGEVQFKAPSTFAFDVVMSDGDVIIRRA